MWITPWLYPSLYILLRIIIIPILTNRLLSTIGISF